MLDLFILYSNLIFNKIFKIIIYFIIQQDKHKKLKFNKYNFNKKFIQFNYCLILKLIKSNFKILLN